MRERIICWLILCPVWEQLGAFYKSEDQHPLVRVPAEFGQVTWFRLHNNRVYRWAVGDPR